MRRQVVDIKIQRVITEYRAEILEDQNGNQTVADFPDKVKRQGMVNRDINNMIGIFKKIQCFTWVT
jgi:RIO-like serine/threonine protein kinase